MNRYAKTSIENIKTAAATYRHDVGKTLFKYRHDAEAAKAYKDETEHLETAKTTARNAIAAAEIEFTATVKAEAKSLNEELHRSLLVVPSDKYLAALNVYATYGFAPGKAEIAALVEKAAGNSLSLRALNAVLQKTGSKWRVKTPSVTDYERDIATLERLGEGNIAYSPQGFHGEAIGVYGGTTRMIRCGDGSYRDTGYTWDSVSILTASNAFDSTVNALDQMCERWADNVLPTIYDATVYAGHTDKTGEKVSGAQEFVEDYTATATAGEVIDNPDAGAEYIGAHARAAAEKAAEAQAIVQRYIDNRGAF